MLVIESVDSFYYDMSEKKKSKNDFHGFSSCTQNQRTKIMEMIIIEWGTSKDIKWNMAESCKWFFDGSAFNNSVPFTVLLHIMSVEWLEIVLRWISASWWKNK